MHFLCQLQPLVMIQAFFGNSFIKNSSYNCSPITDRGDLLLLCFTVLLFALSCIIFLLKCFIPVFKKYCNIWRGYPAQVDQQWFSEKCQKIYQSDMWSATMPLAGRLNSHVVFCPALCAQATSEAAGTPRDHRAPAELGNADLHVSHGKTCTDSRNTTPWGAPLQESWAHGPSMYTLEQICEDAHAGRDTQTCTRWNSQMIMHMQTHEHTYAGWDPWTHSRWNRHVNTHMQGGTCGHTHYKAGGYAHTEADTWTDTHRGSDMWTHICTNRHTNTQKETWAHMCRMTQMDMHTWSRLK